MATDGDSVKRNLSGMYDLVVWVDKKGNVTKQRNQKKIDDGDVVEVRIGELLSKSIEAFGLMAGVQGEESNSPRTNALSKMAQELGRGLIDSLEFSDARIEATKRGVMEEYDKKIRERTGERIAKCMSEFKKQEDSIKPKKAAKRAVKFDTRVFGSAHAGNPRDVEEW